jgi:hypothetical protein
MSLLENWPQEKVNLKTCQESSFKKKTQNYKLKLKTQGLKFRGKPHNHNLHLGFLSNE